MLSPAPPLGGGNAGPSIGAENALLAWTVTKGRGRDAGTTRGFQEGAHLFEATDFFINSSDYLLTGLKTVKEKSMFEIEKNN